MMCVMALFVNLLVVGCFALVYGTKMKYENGMLFGIHMPKEAQKDPEVKILMEQYAVRMIMTRKILHPCIQYKILGIS